MTKCTANTLTHGLDPSEWLPALPAIPARPTTGDTGRKNETCDRKPHIFRKSANFVNIGPSGDEQVPKGLKSHGTASGWPHAAQDRSSAHYALFKTHHYVQDLSPRHSDDSQPHCTCPIRAT